MKSVTHLLDEQQLDNMVPEALGLMARWLPPLSGFLKLSQPI